jgi:hypothetical protein
MKATEVDPDGERFAAKTTVLEELIEHHVAEEEKEMFQVAERLGGERLADLGAEMEAAFDPQPAKFAAGAR